MTTAEVELMYCQKHFGQDKIDYNSHNYLNYKSDMDKWLMSYEYYCQMVEEEEQEEYVKDWIDIDCDKYHEWKDEH